jgi:hypothetical protein
LVLPSKSLLVLLYVLERGFLRLLILSFGRLSLSFDITGQGSLFAQVHEPYRTDQVL